MVYLPYFDVAANRIMDLDQKDVVWKKFYDINFISLRFGLFDASGWEVWNARLFGPVVLNEVMHE